MGNLVCVSCHSACPQGKMSRSNTSGSIHFHTTLGSGNAPLPSDNNVTSNLDLKVCDQNCVLISIPDRLPASTETANGKTLTSWDIYLSPELQSCVLNGCKNEHLTDVEKVAKGIVDVNLFIASQVIFPAMQIYQKELLEEQQKRSNVMTASSDSNADDVLPILRDSEALTIRVDNGFGVRLVDKVTIY